MDYLDFIYHNADNITIISYIALSSLFALKAKIKKKRFKERFSNVELFIYALSMSQHSSNMERMLLSVHNQLRSYYDDIIVRKVNMFKEPTTDISDVYNLFCIYARFIKEFHVGSDVVSIELKVKYDEIISGCMTRLQMLLTSYSNLNASTVFITFYSFMLLELNSYASDLDKRPVINDDDLV